ncbi:beta-lactamase/transpeptidase-like protein [Fusarium sp. MPI-SDFR-AT-0072]|nr:beta-lactamase/transpeptidase-like protein [Fusarium sp. MPI-SDFR-AT-0072]
MHDLVAALEPQMNCICQVSGATGLSASVMSDGKQAYAKHFGFRDLDAKEAPDGDTTYFIGSVTKGMVAALVGILVEEKRLSWSTRIASILPKLQDSGVRSDGIWFSRAGNILFPKYEGIRTWMAHPIVRDFRSDFLYNNYAYDIVGRVIEKIECKNLQETFKVRLWEPLGMHRTYMEDIAGDANAANAYYALEDASSYQVSIPTISHQTIMGAAGAIRSCTNDMAKYYSNFMHAVNHQFHKKTKSSKLTIQTAHPILRPRNQLDLISMHEQSYALGWGRAQLPCPLGTLSYNYLLIPSMPIIGKGDPGQLILYHGGSIQGFNTAVYLLPETEMAIIAMQNSSGLGDATENIDFQQLAIMAAKAAPKLAENIEAELEKRRKNGTKPLDIKAYTGCYWNALCNFHIDVRVHGGRLYMNFQGIENETYELRHYHHHSWTWNVSHNETSKQGRFPTRLWISYIIEFDCGEKE